MMKCRRLQLASALGQGTLLSSSASRTLWVDVTLYPELISLRLRGLRLPYWAGDSRAVKVFAAGDFSAASSDPYGLCASLRWCLPNLHSPEVSIRM